MQGPAHSVSARRSFRTAWMLGRDLCLLAGGPWANRAGRSAARMSLVLPMSAKSFAKVVCSAKIQLVFLKRNTAKFAVFKGPNFVYCNCIRTFRILPTANLIQTQLGAYSPQTWVVFFKRLWNFVFFILFPGPTHAKSPCLHIISLCLARQLLPFIRHLRPVGRALHSLSWTILAKRS